MSIVVQVLCAILMVLGIICVEAGHWEAGIYAALTAIWLQLVLIESKR